jgi:hypothetical protein
MSAHPGTARFGVNTTIHPDKFKAGTDGMGKIVLPIGEPEVETHFVYDPSQASRPMGTTRGGNPGKDFDAEHRQADYMANHDGYVGGRTVNLNLDERKVLHNTIYSVECEWADPGYDNTDPAGWAPRQTITAFD